MPVPKAAPTPTPTKPKPVKKPAILERPVVYPNYQALICCKPVEGHTEQYEGPITVQHAIALLGWVTEPDYIKEQLGIDPTQKDSKLRFGDNYLLKNRDGQKVQCRNNATNRPFDESHSRKIAQDILSKNWDMNGEDIIISRTGMVNSGQHRLVGLVLAWEEWLKQPHWKEVWGEEEPYIESLVFMGASDDPKVLRTYDNVKPRSLSDIFYTSPLFADKNPTDRKTMSRMMDSAVDLLWKRLRASSDGFSDYQTHSASLDFYDRHKKLLACVKHIHDEDMGKENGSPLSSLGMHIGHCAALCYLMGQSATAPERADEYYTAGEERVEKKLDFKHWAKALQFWSDLSKNEEAWCQVVRDALSALNDKNSGRGGTSREQHSVMALAWAKYLLGEKFEKYDDKKHDPMDPDKRHSLHPEFGNNEATNKRFIVEEPTFGGIDRGSVEEKDEADPVVDPEEAKKEAERIRIENLDKMLDVNKRSVPKSPVTVTADTDKKVIPIPTTPRPAPKPLPKKVIGPTDADLAKIEAEAKPKTNGKKVPPKPKAASVTSNGEEPF